MASPLVRPAGGLTLEEVGGVGQILAVRPKTRRVAVLPQTPKVSLRFAQFTAQNISNVTYAVGLLGLRSDALTRALCERLPGRLAEFTAQGLA